MILSFLGLEFGSVSFGWKEILLDWLFLIPFWVICEYPSTVFELQHDALHFH